MPLFEWNCHQALAAVVDCFDIQFMMIANITLASFDWHNSCTYSWIGKGFVDLANDASSSCLCCLDYLTESLPEPNWKSTTTRRTVKKHTPHSQYARIIYSAILQHYFNLNKQKRNEIAMPRMLRWFGIVSTQNWNSKSNLSEFWWCRYMRSLKKSTIVSYVVANYAIHKIQLFDYKYVFAHHRLNELGAYVQSIEIW